MKKIYFLLIIPLFVILTSCSANRGASGFNDLKNSIWVNFTPSELDGDKAVVLNSLFFTDNNRVFMKTGVGQDSTIIATPLPFEYGTYECSGSIKNGMNIYINTEFSTIGPKTDYRGIITPDGIILIEPDSTTYIYHRINLSHNN